MLNFPYATQKLLGPMDCFGPGLIYWEFFSINLKKDHEKNYLLSNAMHKMSGGDVLFAPERLI